jgi:glycosyltransferase involved in cell wall biosynthesis
MARLAVVVDTFPRWSERFIAREVAELLRRGIDTTVFALKTSPLPDPQDADWAGLADRAVVLPFCIVPALTLRKDRKLAAKFEEIRNRIDASSLSRLNCMPSLLDLLRRGKFTHVHAHFAGLPSTIAWLAAEALGLPFTMSVHARDVFVEAQLLEEKLAAAQRVFCCHFTSCAYLKERTKDSQKVVLMHHGLPLDRYRFTWHPRPNVRPLRLFSAGRFVEKKGYADLLTAMPVSGAYALTLAGDGPARRRLERIIRERGMQERVVIRDPLSSSELEQHFRTADIFIAPFRQAADGDIDGVPNTVLEAFAFGLPVAGTLAGGLKELLPGRALLATPDVPALAAGLADMIEYPERAHGEPLAARRLIEEEFALERAIEPLLSQIQA